MHRYLLITIIVACVAIADAGAQNIGFMSRGPVAFLSDAERELLRETVRNALENAADGDEIEWENPESGHGGTITMLNTHEDYGTTCRTVRSRTRAAGRSGGGTYRLCRASDGTWQFAPPRRSDPSD